MKTILVILLLVYVLAVETGHPAGQIMLTSATSLVCKALSMGGGEDCGYQEKRHRTIVSSSVMAANKSNPFQQAAFVSSDAKTPFMDFQNMSNPTGVLKKQASVTINGGHQVLGAQNRVAGNSRGNVLEAKGAVVPSTGETPPWQQQGTSPSPSSTQAAKANKLAGDFGGFSLQ